MTDAGHKEERSELGAHLLVIKGLIPGFQGSYRGSEWRGVDSYASCGGSE